MDEIANENLNFMSKNKSEEIISKSTISSIRSSRQFYLYHWKGKKDESFILLTQISTETSFLHNVPFTKMLRIICVKIAHPSECQG